MITIGLVTTVETRCIASLPRQTNIDLGPKQEIYHLLFAVINRLLPYTPEKIILNLIGNQDFMITSSKTKNLICA